jgi:hypothetical protein
MGSLLNIFITSDPLCLVNPRLKQKKGVIEGINFGREMFLYERPTIKSQIKYVKKL